MEILLGILSLLTGVGVFIAGMNMMGEGLERVADHLINIGYSILTPTGDQKFAHVKA